MNIPWNEPLKRRQFMRIFNREFQIFPHHLSIPSEMHLKHFSSLIFLLFVFSNLVNAGKKKNKVNKDNDSTGERRSSSILSKFGTITLAAQSALSGMAPANAFDISAVSTGKGVAKVEGLYQPPVPAQLYQGTPIESGNSNVPIEKAEKNGESRNLVENNVLDLQSQYFHELAEAEEQLKLNRWAKKKSNISAGNHLEVKVPSVDNPDMKEKLKFFDEIVPFDNKAVGKSPPYGPLRVNGPNLFGVGNQPRTLRGISLMVSTWFPQFWTVDVIKGLACNWNANIVRAPMLVNGYMQNPSVEFNRVVTAIEGAINAGIYILLDWHNVLDSANPKSVDYQNFINQGIKFFDGISRKYPNIPNVLYELWNEPSHYVIGKDRAGNNVYQDLTWADIRRYHDAVIPAIRKNSPNAVIIAGTPGWSSGPKGAVLSQPIKAPNILYTLHWYTVGNVQNDKQRNQLLQARNLKLGTFVSEYGTTGLNANDPVDPGQQVETWWSFMNRYNVGNINWELSNQKENSAALLPSCGAGNVPNPGNCLSASGRIVYNYLHKFNNGITCTRPQRKMKKKKVKT